MIDVVAVIRWRTLCALAVAAVMTACGASPTVSTTESTITTSNGAVPGPPAGTAPPSTDIQSEPGEAPAGPDRAAPAPSDDTVRADPDPVEARSPLADLVTPVGTAKYDPNDHVDPTQPVTISIPQLNVENAPVAPVGVKEGGELDVPDPLVVGWYRGSPTPGADGASVLAAHVNFNGVPGVFRYLRDLEGGERVEIAYDDGTVRAFEVTDVQLYDKDELPEDRVWAKDGDPTLVLFTCGGRFNRAQRSYEDNVVAFAVPVTEG